MNEAVTRKSKYDLTSPAMLKVPSAMYYLLVRLARAKNIHWSELARDYITDRIRMNQCERKKVGDIRLTEQEEIESPVTAIIKEQEDFDKILKVGEE